MEIGKLYTRANLDDYHPYIVILCTMPDNAAGQFGGVVVESNIPQYPVGFTKTTWNAVNFIELTDRAVVLCSCQTFFDDLQNNVLLQATHNLSPKSYLSGAMTALSHIIGRPYNDETYWTTVNGEPLATAHNEDQIPHNAHSLEVFHVVDTPTGKQAYIGYKLENDDFHFITVPYRAFYCTNKT
jgi:hypothetical protein